MAKGLKLNLSSADDLFSTQEERDDAKREKVLDILLSEIDSFPDHPFQVRLDEAMQAMADSVKTFGIQTPAIVRQKEDGRYELVSGHRRKMACELAGLETMPCIIRQMSRDEAIIAMVDSNLQRETILPSEKAKSYKMKMEALNRQGERTDLTFSPVGKKSYAHEQMAQESGESKSQIFRFIRLNELVPEVLQMVDEGKIALTPAVELSYLQPSEQEMLFSVMDSDEVTPSLSQARRLRRMSEAQTLTDDAVLQLLSEVKGNQVEYVKVPVDKLRSFFRPDTSVKQMTETLVKAMDFYNKHLARQRKDRDAR